MPGEDKKMWPTPNQRDTRRGCHQKQLATEVDKYEPKMWPTPTHSDAKTHEKDYVRFDSLTAEINRQRDKMWPTPDSSQRGTRAADLVKNKSTVKRRDSGQERGIDLQTAVKMWPTPQERDFRSPKRVNSKTNYYQLNEEIKESNGVQGQLNPDWVEWLMGWPIGWTSLEPLKELIWLDWEIDPADIDEPVNYPTPRSNEGWQGEGATRAYREAGFVQPTWRYTPDGEVVRSKRGTFDTSLTTAVRARDGRNIGPIPRIATNIPDRVNRLKAIGNGQVPLCAATAWRILSGNETT